MKRREFLSYTLPTAGAIMLAPGFLNFQAMAEINRQFGSNERVDEYDLVINGAGLAGYFAAIEASRKGLKVLIVEKRPSPGFEITAKRKLWLDYSGFESWSDELTGLFFPPTEKPEIFTPGGNGPNNSHFEDELLLFAGTIKKGMLRNLLVNRVHVLLMTEICGVISNDENVSGVLVACKHGLYSIKCRNFMDASDNLLFSRDLTGQPYQIRLGGFVMELLGASQSLKKRIRVSAELGLLNDEILLHRGKNVSQQLFVEFRFPVKTQRIDEIEMQARQLAAEIGKQLPAFDLSLQKAKVHYYAYESSLFLNEVPLPKPPVKGYFALPSEQASLSCKNILQLQESARLSVKNLELSKSDRKREYLHTSGVTIPFREVRESSILEPGLSIPMVKCDFSYTEHIKPEQHCQVLVGGTGTSGAAAAIGASETGASVIAVDYFNDPGGTKTLGGVMGYYHGLRENSYLDRLESESTTLSKQINFSNKPGRQFYFLDHYAKQNVQFLGGAIVCDTLVKNDKVIGILICRNGKLEKIFGDVVIDATGDGDIAFFGGAEASHGNDRNGITQNYSQWNLVGGAKVKSNANSDYDIIDNTKIAELQRGLFLSHYEAHFYDFHPYLTVRESRRIKGLYELTLIDAVEGTHYEDVIMVASSDYDPHFIGLSEFTRCGFLLPHSNIVKVEIPFRSLIPRKLDGILVVGKAFSQTHNALQFTRMSADLTVLGYLTGRTAAKAAITKTEPKDFKITQLQPEWFNLGLIPKEFAHKKPGNKTSDLEEIKYRVENLCLGKGEFLYECCKLEKSKVVPILTDSFSKTNHYEGKLLSAKALAWFGSSFGCGLIDDELVELFAKEQKVGYPGGYIDTYDDIRDRGKNVVEGLFWKINQNIALLAVANHTGSAETIKTILDNTVSGGEMVPRESDYYNERIDLRIIPFYNRILNLCFYAERVPDQRFIPGFEKLLTDKNIGGYVTEEYHNARWKIYGAVLELNIAAALARCGSKRGYHLLASYLTDLHFNLRDFAVRELQELTGADIHQDKGAWQKFIETLTFPRSCKRLTKAVEL